MKCPIDGNALVLSDRVGVEIDYCPECRGVWLDRGELDKIIERSQSAPSSSAQQAAPYRDGSDGHGSKHGSRRGHDGNGQNGRRREGWLGGLFD